MFWARPHITFDNIALAVDDKGSWDPAYPLACCSPIICSGLLCLMLLYICENSIVYAVPVHEPLNSIWRPGRQSDADYLKTICIILVI